MQQAVSAMSTRLLSLPALFALGACIPAYHPPTLADPHATVKVRRTYDTQAGASLREALLVDGHLALRNDAPARLAIAPLIDASLVHPIPATFVMSSRFYHQELRSVYETYYEQEPHYETESYDCSYGYGSNAVHSTCTRSVTRDVQVARQRYVTKWVDVTDAECQATTRFSPAKDRVYLLQYSFQEQGACSLSCFEQVPNPDGTFANSTCSAAPPPQ